MLLDYPVSLDHVVARTKFSLPTSVHSLLHRQRLHDMLDKGHAYPLTLLLAPAGYGKTSLVSEWLRASQPHCSYAWLSLDASDNDVHRFWLCVFLALQRCVPDLIEPLLVLWQEQRDMDVQYILSLLINQLLQEPEARYFLVFDDYHFVTDPAIHQGMTYLIEHLPPQLSLFVTTRVDPPLSLHRLRAQGRLLEVRTQHLQCSPAEIYTFLTETMGLSLTNEAIAEITHSTEGWLAGLQLVACSLQNQSQLADLSLHNAGSQRYVFDYLIEEVIKQQPEQVQRFLLQTCLLETFCASLCDAVWEEGQSQRMLELLQDLHLFMVPLDEEGTWYRYHYLFAQALRHHLWQSLSQEEVISLYVKATTWYTEQAHRDDAVQHNTVLSQDRQHVIALFERSYKPIATFAREHKEITRIGALVTQGRGDDVRRPLDAWLLQTGAYERSVHSFNSYLSQSQKYQSAKETTQIAHASGESEGYVHTFRADDPAPMLLLERDQQEHGKPDMDHRGDAWVQYLIDPLSTREQDVLEVLAQGASNQEIAEALTITPNTVKRHVQTILAKLGVHNRTHAVARAQELDLLAKNAISG